MPRERLAFALRSFHHLAGNSLVARRIRRRRSPLPLHSLPLLIALSACAAPGPRAESVPDGGSDDPDRIVPSLAADEPAPITDALPNDNRTPAGTFEDGTLLAGLEARTAAWRPRLDADTAIVVLAFAEAGRAASIPGPLIRVPQGTDVRLSLRNDVPPGFHVGLPPPRQRRDGLGALATDVLIIHGLRAGTVDPDTIHVRAGETREIRFRADRPGTFTYWGSVVGASITEHTGREATLAGVLVVDPAGEAPDPDERIFAITNVDAFPDTTLPRPGVDVFELAINGRSWPHTERLQYGVGDTVRWRWVNMSGFAHPMHLHGFHFRMLGRGDGRRDFSFSRDSTFLAVTELVEPGATFRLAWVPSREGNWLMHCHIDDHIAAEPPQEREAGSHEHDDVTRHPLESMAGLVLGITVVPDDEEAADLPPRQRLRLTPRERPVAGSDSVLRGFVLEGGRQPSAFASPGPPLILTRDETTEITVVNGISQPTSIHWHGMELESVYDGVAGWARTGSRVAPLIAPGDSFVVQMTPPRAGTYMYHTHMAQTDQLVSGMYGPLLVLEPDEAFDPDTDLLFLVGGGVHDGDYFDVTLNGRMEPPPRTLRAGTRYRLRFMNISPGWTVEMWLEGESGPIAWTSLAVDGADLPAALRVANTQRLRFGAGQTFDFHWTPTAPGSATLMLDFQFPTDKGFYVIKQPIRIR